MPVHNLDCDPNVQKHLNEHDGVGGEYGDDTMGIEGCHNRDKFMALEEDSRQIFRETSHESIEGISEIRYTCDDSKYIKTVYDPNIIATTEMMQWGTEALQNAVTNGEVVVGTASNGLEFRGIVLEDGIINNFIQDFERENMNQDELALVHDYFDRLLFADWMFALESFSKGLGYSPDRYEGCNLPNDIHNPHNKTLKQYYDGRGIRFRFSPPIREKLVDFIMDYDEFYQLLEGTCIQHVLDKPEDKDEAENYMMITKQLLERFKQECPLL